MGNVQRQRGNIVLYKEKRDNREYIRIDYAGNKEIHELLTQDTGIETFGYGSAYITAATFRLPDFYDRYSPHAYIDTAGFMSDTPNLKGNTHCRKDTWNCWNKSVIAPRP